MNNHSYHNFPTFHVCAVIEARFNSFTEYACFFNRKNIQFNVLETHCLLQLTVSIILQTTWELNPCLTHYKNTMFVALLTVLHKQLECTTSEFISILKLNVQISVVTYFDYKMVSWSHEALTQEQCFGSNGWKALMLQHGIISISQPRATV